ncbi:MAG: TonB family protein [Terriglobales bacterium]
MPVTQIPSRDPSSSSSGPPSQEQRDLFQPQHWETAYRSFNADNVPHLLIQLQDDLARARKREAIWLSIIIHLFLVILLWNSDKLVAMLPHQAVPLELRADQDREKDATFLALPPDQQKVTRRPDSKIVSDKDRIATSKTPQINREELKKILESTRPGQPGPAAPQPQPQPGPPPPQTAQNQAPPQQPTPQNQEAGSGFSQPRQSDQIAQMHTPAQGESRVVPNFNNTTTAGSAIEQAEQAAAANRGRYGGGQSGDYGLSQGRGGAKALDQAEILTDTMGVDFGPYLTRVVQVVKANWYNLMPPSVYPPILKQGKLSIEFVIQKDGSVSGMTLHTSSGDVPLDRAAWASITASNPFPPLPKEFPGQILGLRFYYFYNLQPEDLK